MFRQANINVLQGIVPQIPSSAPQLELTPSGSITQPAQKRARLETTSDQGTCILFSEVRPSPESKNCFNYGLEFELHPQKYVTRLIDAKTEDDIFQAYGKSDFIEAAYARSSWNKIMSARNCFVKFESATGKNFSSLLEQHVIKEFIEWAIFRNEMSAGTVEAYLHCIKIIHRLKNSDGSASSSKIIKLLLREAEFLEFYKPPKSLERRVMTLPLLRLIGHEVAKCDWSKHSKMVVWASPCVGFFGSFRFGEILSKHEDKFNPHETLLGRDIIFLNDDSV